MPTPDSDRPKPPFVYCPGCGARGPVVEGGNHLRCTACGFEYFHNAAAGQLRHHLLARISGGDRSGARAVFDRVLAGSAWPAFGYLAAEAEVARRRAPRD